MATPQRLINTSAIVVFLVGCSSVNATTAPNSMTPQFPQPAPRATVSATLPVLASTPSITSSPFPTPNQTQVVIRQLGTSTQSIFQTKVAQFPRLCPENVPHVSDHDTSFSPNGLWLGELCLSYEYKDLVLTFSNKKTQVVWKMFYHDYIPATADSADGGMRVMHWSNDSRYVYFYTWLSGSVGECFYNGYDTGSGLFRLDLQTGQTKEILPLNDDLRWYGFSISPTGKQLVYGVRSLDLQILDLTTGQLINVRHKKNFSQSGGYIWSPDGLEFVYSTVTYTPDHVGRENYSLRLVDALSGRERILLEVPDACFDTVSWAEDNILTLTKNYNEALIEFDLNSNTIMSETTTP